MSLLKSTSEGPAISIPFIVRFEPYLVETICELSRLLRDKGHQNNDISGLLFGTIEGGNRTVEALKTFADVGTHSELARRERWEKAYQTALEESRSDPELAAFEIVGWFSYRTGRGLLSSDVVFHNRHFRRPDDLAVIIWREDATQLTTEVYSKSDSDAMTSDDYRWASVRLSTDIRQMREPIALSMRAKISEDAFLRSHDEGEQQTQGKSLRRMAEAASEKFSGFLNRSKESTDQQSLPPRSHIDGGEIRASGSKPEGPPAPSSSGSAFASAAARSATVRAEQRMSEPRLSSPSPSAGMPLDVGNIGRRPRTGRSMPTEVSGLPMVLRPAHEVKKPFPWPWAAGLFLVCSALVFAFLVMGGLQSDGGRIGQIFQAAFPSGELNLKVRNEDDRLRLSWNQRNRAVASATDATLQIFDGQQHRDIHLDGRQVGDGSVLYRPLTADVTFRLEVHGDQGSTTGSVRVVDGLPGRQAILDVSAPTTQTEQAQTGAKSVPATSDASGSREGAAPNQPSEAASPARSGAAADTANPPPLGTPRTPGAQADASKPDDSTYETPQTVGTLNYSGATKIHGWDETPTPRSRAKRPVPAPAQARPTPTPEARGSLAGYVPPRPLMQVMPNTRAIPDGTIQARTRVEVQVNVDQTGRVSSAQVVSSGVNEQISSAALSAARRWTFDPASNNGQRVNSVHTIVFEFRPEQR